MLCAVCCVSCACSQLGQRRGVAPHSDPTPESYLSPNPNSIPSTPALALALILTLTLESRPCAGYHNMCRWNFRGMLEHPRIRNLDYYCRMDTDSRVKKKVRV